MIRKAVEFVTILVVAFAAVAVIGVVMLAIGIVEGFQRVREWWQRRPPGMYLGNFRVPPAIEPEIARMKDEMERAIEVQAKISAQARAPRRM